MINKISPSLLTTLGHDVVRAHLPYEILDSCHIELRAIDHHSGLGELFLPWYRAEHGGLYIGDVSNPDPANIPIPFQIKDIDAYLHLAGRLPTHSIDHLAQNFIDHKYPQTFSVIGAGLPSGEIILLDGCHRSAALWRARTPFRLAILVIIPPSPKDIIDLARMAEYLTDKSHALSLAPVEASS